MENNQTPAWAGKVHQLYFVSLIAWAAATLPIVIQALMTVWPEDFYITEPHVAVGLMLLALPGLLFFYLQSRKMRNANEAQAHTIFDRIMAVQHLTGVIAVGGAFLGLLPFVINFFGFLDVSSTSLLDLWINVPMMLPWVSLYGFVATYIIAIGLSKSRHKKTNPEA